MKKYTVKDAIEYLKNYDENMEVVFYSPIEEKFRRPYMENLGIFATKMKENIDDSLEVTKDPSEPGKHFVVLWGLN